MTNYAAQQDLKNIIHVDSSNFALKANLNSLKTDVDKLDIPKLIPVPTDLAKLSDLSAESSINNLKTMIVLILNMSRNVIMTQKWVI